MTAPPNACAPGGELQQTIGEIVRMVLSRNVDSSVDLFDQGATSMAFIRIIAEVNKRYEITLDVAELEEASTDMLSMLVAKQLNSQETVKARS